MILNAMMSISPKAINTFDIKINDALVEFTGALAGFTLALSDSKLIALTGSIIRGVIILGAFLATFH